MDSNVWSELPAELKIEILTTTAHMYPQAGAAVRFALISRQFQRMFEPLIYRSMTVRRFSTKPLPDFPSTSKPASFFASHVQHLYLAYSIHMNGLSGSTHEFLPWLKLCPNIRSLAYFDCDGEGNAVPLAIASGCPRLTHLFLESYSASYPQLPTVTHLFLHSPIPSYEDLQRFPNVTHFSAVANYSLDVRKFLDHRPELEVFVVVFYPDTSNPVAEIIQQKTLFQQEMKAWAGDKLRIRTLMLPQPLWRFEKPWEFWEMAGCA